MHYELVIGNYNYSSWSMRAFLVMVKSGLDFSCRRVLLDVPGYKEELRAISGAARVPVLLCRTGKPPSVALPPAMMQVWDSLAIAEYIAEQVPGLWPDDPWMRAEARAVSAEMHSGFMALRQEMPMNCRARRTLQVSAQAQQDCERVVDIWTSCRTRYEAQGSFLFGRWSIADAMFAPVASRFRTYGRSLPAAAAEYQQALLDDPASRRWLQHAEEESEVLTSEEVGISVADAHRS